MKLSLCKLLESVFRVGYENAMKKGSVWLVFMCTAHAYVPLLHTDNSCKLSRLPVMCRTLVTLTGLDSARAMLMRISLQFVSFPGFVDEAFRSLFKLIAFLDFCSPIYSRDLIFVFLMFTWNTDLGEIIWLVLIMINYTGVLGEQFNLCEILDCLLRW